MSGGWPSVTSSDYLRVTINNYRLCGNRKCAIIPRPHSSQLGTVDVSETLELKGNQLFKPVYGFVWGSGALQDESGYGRMRGARLLHGGRAEMRSSYAMVQTGHSTYQNWDPPWRPDRGSLIPRGREPAVAESPTFDTTSLLGIIPVFEHPDPWSSVHSLRQADHAKGESL